MLKAITADQAAEIVRLLLETKHRDVALVMLRDIQRRVHMQRQEIRSFCMTVQSVQEQYHRLIYASRQLLERLDATLDTIARHIDILENRRYKSDTLLRNYEHSLPSMQNTALERHRKRQWRQSQYQKLHWLPVLSTCYKVKYLRARDKHAEAEHQVAELRNAIDSSRQMCYQISQSVDQAYQERDQTYVYRNQVKDKLAQCERILGVLLEAVRFWSQFDKHQAQVVLEAAQYLCDNQIEHGWTVTFKMACFEYEQCIAYGKEHHTQIDIPYECISCKETRIGWPNKDLICQTCTMQEKTLVPTTAKASSSSPPPPYSKHASDAKPAVKQLFKNIIVAIFHVG